MPDVRLVDLEIIKRFSLAVRRDTVPASELLEALEASVATVQAALDEAPPVRKRAPAKKAAAPAKKATTRKAAPRKAQTSGADG